MINKCTRIENRQVAMGLNVISHTNEGVTSYMRRYDGFLIPFFEKFKRINDIEADNDLNQLFY